MKALTINTVQYQLIIKSFKNWLETLNYSQSAIKNYPIYVKELLYYAETKQINQIEKLESKTIEGFIRNVKTRKNETLGGGLSANYINNIINGTLKFLEYLRLTDKHTLHVELTRLKVDTATKDILTQAEIISLFQALDQILHPIAKRNKAIIACFYGAGLRLNETVQLNLEDVSIRSKTIHVKHGKGNKERLVPLTNYFTSIIEDYIKNCRDVLEGIAETTEPALFIGVAGERIKKDNYYNILKTILDTANIESLANKKITPHTFRHSVATHLLQMDMEIEDIARFLGHSSLESTMIYTHIVEELKHQNHE